MDGPHWQNILGARAPRIDVPVRQCCIQTPNMVGFNVVSLASFFWSLDAS